MWWPLFDNYCVMTAVSQTLSHDHCVMTNVWWRLCHDHCVTTSVWQRRDHCVTTIAWLCGCLCVNTPVWPPLCHDPCVMTSVTTTALQPPYESSSLFSIFTRPFNKWYPASNYPKKVTNSYSVDLSTNMMVRNICIQYFFMEKPLSIYSMYNCIAVRIGG